MSRTLSKCREAYAHESTAREKLYAAVKNSFGAVEPVARFDRQNNPGSFVLQRKIHIPVNAATRNQPTEDEIKAAAIASSDINKMKVSTHSKQCDTVGLVQVDSLRKIPESERSESLKYFLNQTLTIGPDKRTLDFASVGEFSAVNTTSINQVFHVKP